MTLRYTVSEYGGIWYAHRIGKPNAPVNGSFGTRDHAEEYAAMKDGISAADWRMLRRYKNF